MAKIIRRAQTPVVQHFKIGQRLKRAGRYAWACICGGRRHNRCVCKDQPGFILKATKLSVSQSGRMIKVTDLQGRPMPQEMDWVDEAWFEEAI